MFRFSFNPRFSLRRLRNKIESINRLEPKFEKFSDREILNYSRSLKEKVYSGASKEEIVEEAFALVREAAKRTLQQRHFDVQILAGLVLYKGAIAEMKTGEGKTLAATLAAFVESLCGKGVHIVTVNDYLAKRDTVWMGQIFYFLGCSVGCIVSNQSFIYDPNFVSEEKREGLDEQRDKLGTFKVFYPYLRPVSRREAYLTDITYGTNHEFGFDYLRDNLVSSKKDQVQRPFNYAIIDEVDSILIDEARTPLIISYPDKESSFYYKVFASIVKKLAKGEDYLIDEKRKGVELLDRGVEKVEKILKIDNLFSPKHFSLVHYLQESLKAKELFLRDRDYLVKDNQIVLIDEFTGQLLYGRRYSGGLHQAIEAKEKVFVREENKTIATITLQNYFRMYPKISGMTGTAVTSAEEFNKVYKLEVVEIPTNKPMIRKDLKDLIFRTKTGKYKAVIKEIKQRHEKGQPILIGTNSVEKNEKFSKILKEENIPHQILNAKNNEKEGEIIAQAGKKGAITVATNLAGRGVDIILGGSPFNPSQAEEVKKCGGLHVIGLQRHESRRIDDQLKGRAGRQGDIGSSQFFLSLEDDLLRIFGGEKIKTLMQFFNIPEDVPIESKMVSRAVREAQKKVEGMNFDIRYQLLEYDDVLNKQRTYIYKMRQDVLEAKEKGNLMLWIKNYLNIEQEIRDVSSLQEEELKEQVLRIIDTLWMFHLENLETLRESISLRAYGQRDPLIEYRYESYKLFKQLLSQFSSLIRLSLNKILG